jgi:hypothetical protein
MDKNFQYLKTILDKKSGRQRDRCQSFYVLKGSILRCFVFLFDPRKMISDMNFFLFFIILSRWAQFFMSFGIIGEHGKIFVTYSFRNLKYFGVFSIYVKIFLMYSETISRKNSAEFLVLSFLGCILRIQQNTFGVFSEYD